MSTELCFISWISLCLAPWTWATENGTKTSFLLTNFNKCLKFYQLHKTWSCKIRNMVKICTAS